MRNISKLNIEPSLVYSKCLNSIGSRTKREKFRSVKNYIKRQSEDYDISAANSQLYTIPIVNNINGVLAANDMKNLYSQQMVRKLKGRKIYDKIMSLAPLDRCPFCGIGTVSTLDHYLPKVKFPVYAVLPYNLVPSCKDCNTGKSQSHATTEETQTLHPYYDNFTEEQWLFAEVIETSPVSITYFVNAPSGWNNIKKNRVKAHFDNYYLGSRFSIEASNELAILKEEFIRYTMDKDSIQKSLDEKTQTYRALHINSWQTALYQALSENDWYCEGGYNDN